MKVIKRTRTHTCRRAIISAVCILAVFALIVYIPPLIVIGSMTQRVEYDGMATADRPLQAVYSAADFGMLSNDMMLTAEDGVKIFVSEVKPENPAGIVIFLTGIRQPSVTYFYPQAKWLAENGYSSFLLEVRGHGKSGGRVALGYEEPRDVAAVMEYIAGSPEYDGLPVTVCGVSMGGAAAVNAFGSIEEIDGLIAMSAYASFEDEVYDMMEQYYAPRIFCEAGRHSARLWLGAYFGKLADTMTPKAQIANARGRSVLLIAAAEDASVSSKNVIRLASACKDGADIWIRSSGDHFIIKDCDFLNFRKDEEYCRRILNFLNDVSD